MSDDKQTRLREGLRRLARELDDLDARREELVMERDALMFDARDAGVSWTEMQSDTGLSVRSVAKSLKRAQAGE